MRCRDEMSWAHDVRTSELTSSGIPNPASVAVRPMNIGDRIRSEIEADPAKNMVGCAKHAGLGKSTLSEIVNGRSKSSTKLHLIAEYLGVTPKWLETGKGLKTPQELSRHVVAGFDEAPSCVEPSAVRRVSVVGTASLGMDGFWTDLEYPKGHGDGFFEFPTRDQESYVLQVRGSSMHPAIRSGWYVLVEPNRTPQMGEFVLVKLVDGRSTVKEFLWHRDGEFALNAVSTGDRMVLRNDEVEFVHRVGGILPPSGRQP